MTKIADLFASILGVVAACLFSFATASTCSVAFAGASPATSNPPVCKANINYLCPDDNDCVAPKPNCDYTDLTQLTCSCQK